jgi:hypothetical protein
VNERDRTAAGRYIQPHAECNVLAPFATAPLGATDVPLQLGQLTRVYARARVWVAWGTVRILAWGTVRVLHGVLAWGTVRVLAWGTGMGYWHGVLLLSGCCWVVRVLGNHRPVGVRKRRRMAGVCRTAAFACALQPRRHQAHADLLRLRLRLEPRLRPRLRRCLCLSDCLPVCVDVCVRTDVRLQTQACVCTYEYVTGVCIEFVGT